MVALVSAVFLAAVATCHAAVFNANRPVALQKRALDSAEENGKFYVETVRSLSPPSSGYLPASEPVDFKPDDEAAASSAQEINGRPISVTFNSFEAPKTSTTSTSTSSSAPTTATKITSAPTTSTTTTSTSADSAVTKKRPSGGLGSFAYYGGRGASSAKPTAVTTTTTTGSSSPAIPSPALSAPQAVAQNPQVIDQGFAQLFSNQRSSTKTSYQTINGYDYPSPKNIRKPSKKEQKLADSRQEESEVDYRYEPSLQYIGDSTTAIANGGHHPAPAAPGMMGMSYMRQSSPFFSYHVMLD